MLKLLNENFYKLKKDKIFWLINFISFVLAIITLFRYQSFKGIITLDRIATEYMSMYLGILIAFFITTFIGREYTEGVIRNKIISGHKRFHIYLANLIVCIVAGLIAEIIYIFTVFFIGKHLYGQLQMMSLFKILLYTLLIVVVYSSIYNFMTMSCADVSMSLVVCIIIFVAMFVINGIVGPKVIQSKYVVSKSYGEDGKIISIEKKIKPNYPSETKMKVYKSIYFLLPTGQADVVQGACTEIMDMDNEDTKEELNRRKENLNEMPIYAIILILISNIVGIYLFNKQELK